MWGEKRTPFLLDPIDADWHVRLMHLRPRQPLAAVLFALPVYALVMATSAGCGSAFVAGGESDASATSDATIDDGAAAVDASASDGSSVDGNADAGCTPDPLTCSKACGTVVDNCGQPRACSTDCGEGSICNGNTHACECQVIASWCASKCGATTDNCGGSTNCGQCPGGLPCVKNACGGCIPEDPSATCKGKACGAPKNNCGQQVACGANGTTSCASSTDVCTTDDTCCTPDNAAACAGKCATNAVNNCGQTIACPSTCAAGSTCKSSACCFDCSHYAGQCGTALDDGCGNKINCGCTSPRVCGGVTTTKGASTCCLSAKSVCTTDADCCSGDCSLVAQPQGAGAGTPQPVGGTCQ